MGACRKYGAQSGKKLENPLNNLSSFDTYCAGDTLRVRKPG
jgi:hypothetical protein